MIHQPPGSTLDDLSQSPMTKRRVSAGRCRLLALLLLLLPLAPTASASAWDGVAISQANYEGLLAFKHALLDPTGALRGWNDSGLDVCSGAWEGIKCAKGQVIAIQLPWHSLGGTISDKVGQLTALRKLNLHDNALHGKVPAALGLLTGLRGVYLFNNRFSGRIPPSIGNCLVLQTLDLSNNLLTGTIPASISNSTNLYRLNLSYNKLVGSIPTDLTLLPSLGFLSLHHNNISGPIPNTWGDTNTTHHLRILNLDYNRLSGSIPTSLGRLPMLQDVTLSNNQIDGSIPVELGKLPMLEKLDLSHNSIAANFQDSLCNVSTLVHLNLEGNQLGGSIPDAIDGLKNLTFLSLKWNRFTGPIPSTLGRIVNLLELDLSDNDLVGEIPVSFAQLTHLSAFNVSNNNLSGPVPPLLAENFNSTSFAGNIQLCGYSTSVPCPSSPPPPSSNVTPIASPSTYSNSGNRRSSTGSVILLVVVGLVALLLVLCCVLLVCCLIRKRAVLAKKSAAASGAARRAQKPGDAEGESGGDAGGKLVHFDGPMAFTADDLLCATAEIMGKTAYGTIYKATLEDGSQVAVKRLREKVSKSPKEFEGEVAVLGKIRHPNLLPLRAYYLGPKGEKLLVFDYMPKGSLASFLHARSPDTQIDWPSRIKLATGITRGLHHLHASENIIHGNLASSAILLDDAANPYITDYGLSRLMTAAAAATTTPTAGSLAYRAPELAKQKKATSKSDVYGLGIVMLEILTGRSPGETMNSVDLPQWVASVSEEEWGKEVFDPELLREGTAATAEEMLDVLKLAMRCVDPSPAARPEVENVLRQLEETAGGAGGSTVEVGSTGTSSS